MSNALAGADAKAMGQCAREKYWEEMTDSEKIAALRESVVWMARELWESQKTIAALRSHSHAQDGSLMVPMEQHPANLAAPMHYSADYARRIKTERERQR
jgi:hypothetical protein